MFSIAAFPFLHDNASGIMTKYNYDLQVFRLNGVKITSITRVKSQPSKTHFHTRNVAYQFPQSAFPQCFLTRLVAIFFFFMITCK